MNLDLSLLVFLHQNCKKHPKDEAFTIYKEIDGLYEKKESIHRYNNI